jgi:hypothetical protein
MQTLMSTDIIRYPGGQDAITHGTFSGGALELFVVLTVPLMSLTLLFYWLYYRRARKSEKG